MTASKLTTHLNQNILKLHEWVIEAATDLRFGMAKEIRWWMVGVNCRFAAYTVRRLAAGRYAVKLVEYEDVPARCDELLDEVAKAGTTFQVMKDGKPMLRVVPVEEVAEKRSAGRA
jgi:hypothetical protein